MGRDEHVSSETVKFNFFNKEHIFHITPTIFPYRKMELSDSNYSRNMTDMQLHQIF